MIAALTLLAAQGLLGGLDNVLHHEWRERLPARVSAGRELYLHACREGLYAVIFLALAWGHWHGLWAWALAVILIVEIVITIADFLDEDRTRRLPPLERVFHTLLAIGFGAFMAVLAPHLADWASRPTAVEFVDYGPLSWLLSAYSAGVFAFSIRNFIASHRLHERGAALRVPPAPRPDAPTILITGGTGFIGRALVAELVDARQRIIVLTRDAKRAADLFGPSVRVIEDLDLLPRETRIDAIVNLAGAPIVGGPWTSRRREILRDSRIQPTRALIGLIRRLERKPSVLISASGVGVYGPHGPEPLDETTPGQSDFLSRLSRAWEGAALEAKPFGVRTVILRFGLVLGRGGGILAPLSLSARLGLGAVIGTGRQMVSWIHLADAVGLIRFAIDSDTLDGPVNAVAPDAVAQTVFAGALAAAHARSVHIRVPAAVLRAALGDLSLLLLDGQNASPAKAQNAGYRFRYVTLERTLEDLTRRNGTSQIRSAQIDR